MEEALLHNEWIPSIFILAVTAGTEYSIELWFAVLCYRFFGYWPMTTSTL